MNLENLCIEKIQRAKELGSQVLDLSFMGLSSIPETILELEYLVELDLSNNSFTRLPHIINELSHLKKLHLRNNCFSYLNGVGFDIINDLKIEYIDLSLNNLSRIPEDVFYLSILENIDLKGNPLMYGIPEGIIEQGYLTIHYFVEELNFSEIADKLLEAKLIFVGQGEVGKTSLMKKILNPNDKIIVGYEPTTHGINVKKWTRDVYFNDEEIESILNEEIEIGGDYISEEDQEEYIYEKDQEEYRESPFEEDINLVLDIKYDVDHNTTGLEVNTNENLENEYYNPLTDENQVNINKSENGVLLRKQNFRNAQFNIWDFGGQEIYYSTHQFFLTKRSIYVFVWDARKEEDYDRFLYWFNTINILSEKSPIIVVMNKSDIREKQIEEIDLIKSFPNIIGFHKTSCKTDTGIKELVNSIDIAFKKLPHIGDRLPINWLHIRNDLSELKEDYITYERFIEICSLYKIPKSRANFFSSYLHDLGDILHFQNDEILLKIVILKPDWVTQAFYRLIDSRYIQVNNGKFFLDQLVHVLDIEVHPKDKYLEIIRLIENFELCFNILGTKEYILPELLPINPVYINAFVHAKYDTKFQYEFKFMPSGLMTRFICRNFVMIKNNAFWKNGVVVQYEDSSSLIIVDVIEKKIKIRINGDDREGLLGVIRKEFNTIFQSLNLSLDDDYSEMVPCNCEVCLKSAKAFYFKFSHLKNFIKKNVHKTHCPISADELSVVALIKGFEKIRPAERILEHLLISCAQLQGIHKTQISNREDDRNTFIALSLTNRGLIAKDQTRWGSSASGKMQGELDIKLESEFGVTLGIFEGFNLNYLDKTVIHSHLKKVFNYDPNGLGSNYVVVYVDNKDFMNLWQKYQQIAVDVNYKYEMISEFQDMTITYNSVSGSNIRIGRVAFRINSDRNYMYHIFVKMNL